MFIVVMLMVLCGCGEKASTADDLASTEVVLPNGEIVRTGTGAAGWDEITGRAADADTNMVVMQILDAAVDEVADKDGSAARVPPCSRAVAILQMFKQPDKLVVLSVHIADDV